MKPLTRWAEAFCVTTVLQLSFSSSLVTAAGWTSSRKLEARNKTRDLWYHGFNAYYKYAFPLDELTPLSCSGKGPDWENPANIVYNDVAGNYSLTLVDVLDSLVVLDDYTGFDRAVRDTIGWVSFNSNTKPQVFETTIRVLGGLLSAHQFASDPKHRFFLPWYRDELLRMAKDLGERLLPAFQTPTGIPYARLNLRHGVQAGESIETCTAGAGSLLLEFATLSRLTGDDRFEKAAYKAYFALWNRRSDIGLVGNTINIVNGKWNHPEVSSVGAGIDSFFEYALKFYILSGETEFLDVWTESYASIMRYVRTMNGFTFSSSNIHSGDLAYHMTDSLSAFWPGLQVLAGDVENAIKSHQIYWNIWKTYSGLPEVFDLGQKIATSSQYPLRPEFIESTWYLYRATRDPFYLDVGERVLRDLSHRAVVECGLTGIQDLQTNTRDDRMESFVLSETLKYLYLLFDEANPLNSDDSNYVLTTEGHIIMMDKEQIRPISASRRKIRGPDRSQCPAYQTWLSVKDHQNPGHGLAGGIWQRPDIDYARTLVNAPHVASDAKHWSVEGWCALPPVQLYTYDFILSTTGKSVPEELSPSPGKVSHVDDGYVVHNITGLRAHIVSRLDGKGYDLTKIGPYTIRSGQSVYFDDPDLIAAVNQLNAAKASVAQRKAEVQLHIFSDILDPVISAQGTLEEFPTDDVVFTGFTSSFGGDPAAISPDGTSPLAFGRGDGVPVVQAWNNTYGCLPFTEKFHDEAIVVHRGQCTFFEKLIRAMDAGASGVIVIDDDDNGIHPSAEKKEIEDAGEGLNSVALVVIQRSAGKVLERMLNVADDLDATIWLMVHPDSASSKAPPTEPTPTTEPKMLYINGHGLINTRLLP